MSSPLQRGIGLLRRLRPPVRTLAFSCPTLVGQTALEFPSSVRRDVRATRSCLLGSDIHVMLVKRFCATVGQHRLPIQQRSTENHGHPRGVSPVSVTPV